MFDENGVGWVEMGLLKTGLEMGFGGWKQGPTVQLEGAIVTSTMLLPRGKTGK